MKKKIRRMTVIWERRTFKGGILAPLGNDDDSVVVLLLLLSGIPNVILLRVHRSNRPIYRKKMRRWENERRNFTAICGWVVGFWRIQQPAQSTCVCGWIVEDKGRTGRSVE